MDEVGVGVYESPEASEVSIAAEEVGVYESPEARDVSTEVDTAYVIVHGQFVMVSVVAWDMC